MPEPLSSKGIIRISETIPQQMELLLCRSIVSLENLTSYPNATTQSLEVLTIRQAIDELGIGKRLPHVLSYLSCPQQRFRPLTIYSLISANRRPMAGCDNFCIRVEQSKCKYAANLYERWIPHDRLGHGLGQDCPWGLYKRGSGVRGIGFRSRLTGKWPQTTNH